MRKKVAYTDTHAHSGLAVALPKIQTWPNQYEKAYEVEIVIPEFTSVCPKTHLPDFGEIIITYTPGARCLESKSLKMYVIAYRDLGIFSENVVNRFLRDIVRSCSPVAAKVVGRFVSRGGLAINVTATFTSK